MALLPRMVIPPPPKTCVVGVADMVATNDPAAEIVTYSLGSCLGVVVYDPVRKAGGLLHLMLPTSEIDPTKAQAQPFMFVDTGVPRLFRAIYGLGGERQRLVVKVAGGAQVCGDNQLFNIGARNVTAIKTLLSNNGLNIHAHDVGGNFSRTVRFKIATGAVSVHVPTLSPYAL